MKGMDADAPSKPFGGAEEFTFTPDGRAVVFTARDAGTTSRGPRTSTCTSRRSTAAARRRNLTTANAAWDTGPVFSPDGRTLAYRAMARAGYEADRFRIVLRSWPDGEPRSPDRGLGPIAGRRRVVGATAQTIYTTADQPRPEGALRHRRRRRRPRTSSARATSRRPAWRATASSSPSTHSGVAGRPVHGQARRHGTRADHAGQRAAAEAR